MSNRRQEVVQERVESAPVSAKGALEAAYRGKASPRAAIKAMCLSCVAFDRSEITACTGYSCPLWLYRPFQK